MIDRHFRQNRPTMRWRYLDVISTRNGRKLHLVMHMHPAPESYVYSLYLYDGQQHISECIEFETYKKAYTYMKKMR